LAALNEAKRKFKRNNFTRTKYFKGMTAKRGRTDVTVVTDERRE